MNELRYSNGTVADLPVADRSEFIWRTYAHVVGAILAFAAIEFYLVSNGIAETLAQYMFGNWLMVLGAFMLVSWGASHVAHTLESKPAQYAAFAVFVFAEALLFAPVLYIAAIQYPGVIESAATVTILGSMGLIAVAMITGRNFSFLRGILTWGFVLALVAIVGSLLFGFELGTWFSVAMIGFAGAAILFDTSKIMRDYPQDRYVAAAMQLFASIALMFWYVLRLFMARD
jgi:FtsH-binding integral membrane protein